jgi:hypothetical protein
VSDSLFDHCLQSAAFRLTTCRPPLGSDPERSAIRQVGDAAADVSVSQRNSSEQGHDLVWGSHGDHGAPGGPLVSRLPSI